MDLHAWHDRLIYSRHESVLSKMFWLRRQVKITLPIRFPSHSGLTLTWAAAVKLGLGKYFRCKTFQTSVPTIVRFLMRSFNTVRRAHSIKTPLRPIQPTIRRPQCNQKQQRSIIPDAREKDLSQLSLSEDSSKSSQDANTFTIDPRGHLTLTIGRSDSSKKFVVCSRTLSRGSRRCWNACSTAHLHNRSHYAPLLGQSTCQMCIKEPCSSNELEMYKVLFISQEGQDR